MAEHGCEMHALAEAMYAVLEQRGMEDTQTVIMLNVGDDTGGHDVIAVFAPREGATPQKVLADAADHLATFAAAVGIHVDLYANGVRLGAGRPYAGAS